MAIVREFVSESGVRVIVRDDCYRDKTPEQLAAVDLEIAAAIRRIYASAERSRKEGRAHEERKRKDGGALRAAPGGA